MFHRTSEQVSSPIGQVTAEQASPAHTPTPWCIPAGEQNGFIICAGDDPQKPGDILMVLRAPFGRSSVLTDADIKANTTLIVKAVNSHEALLERIARLEADLNECREFIEPQVDTVDSDDGYPQPNHAMQLVCMIDETLNGRPY